jgi:signal peptidase I
VTAQNPFEPQQPPPPLTKASESAWETIKLILQALGIALVIKTFLFQPYSIPSSSMYPTLMIGDYVFVPKLTYGYGKHSFDFTLGRYGDPMVSCCSFVNFGGRKIFAAEPERGDIAVFKLPTDTKVDYIKRVIGLPGDRIQMKQGVLHINGVAIKKERVADYVDPTQEHGSSGGTLVPQFVETLPNGVQYRVLDSESQGDADSTVEYTVPTGHYFMMGDNRDNSVDSRFLSEVGFVPIENFVGRADVMFFSVKPGVRPWQIWKLASGTRWGRFPGWLN